ncbi:MAG: glycerophosphodiester phosphodiesterase [Bacteroidota bacterium]
MKSPLKLSLIMLLFACTTTTESPQQSLDIQGHRGCRGLLPENSIPAFEHALLLGVNTLEIDAVITQDKEVIVSHEPFMSHEICLDPQGNEILEADELSHNIYQMTYAQVQQYDCGTKAHHRFPNQKQMSVHKPLLREVIQHAEAYQKTAGKAAVLYNIETKSRPDRDDVYHPKPKEFVDLLVAIFKETGIYDRTTLQSFDIRTLQYAHQTYPDLQLVLLIENQKTLEENLDALGFVPEVYSPYFEFVDEQMVSSCQQKGMKLIPWTVNSPSDIQQILQLGVDGIISDYPDRVLEIVGK